MKSATAFFKKEWMEQLRTGKLLILGCIFALFGVMNPAVAKLTPLLMEELSDTLASSGITVTEVKVTAMDSWVQFFKNIPMALIVFILLESGIFTREYDSGTLLLSLTKGLNRTGVVLAKTTMLTVLWSGVYWMCYAITYGYNDYFWDNSIASNLGLSVICWWIFGLWVIGLLVLFSTIQRTNSIVLVSTGGVVAACYFAGLFPKVKKFLPTTLTDGNSLIYGIQEAGDYAWALWIAGTMIPLSILGAVCFFRRKQI